MDRGALRVIVHGVAKGQTQLNDKHTHTHTHTHYPAVRSMALGLGQPKFKTQFYHLLFSTL